MEPIKNIWTTKNVYVDTETGIELTKYLVVQNNYKIINKIKNVQRDQNTGHKYVEIINECRRNKYKQQRIEFK